MDSEAGILPAVWGCLNGGSYAGEPVFARGCVWGRIMVLDNLT